LIEVMLPINRRRFIKTGTAATALSLLPGSLQAAYTNVANSNRNGFDIYKEIRWLGKERIGEFHLKDNPKRIGQVRSIFRKSSGPSWLSTSAAGRIWRPTLRPAT